MLCEIRGAFAEQMQRMQLQCLPKSNAWRQQCNRRTRGEAREDAIDIHCGGVVAAQVEGVVHRGQVRHGDETCGKQRLAAMSAGLARYLEKGGRVSAPQHPAAAHQECRPDLS